MSGQDTDNKIVSTTVPVPQEAEEEFTDRPVHMHNNPEYMGIKQEKEGLYESGM